MSDEKTDNTDEPSKAELHDRVRKLESTVEKLMPSRRDALKLGAAGIAGAAGLSATTQPADAATGSAGQIGDVNNRPDVFADTVDANERTLDTANNRVNTNVTETSGVGTSNTQIFNFGSQDVGVFRVYGVKAGDDTTQFIDQVGAFFSNVTTVEQQHSRKADSRNYSATGTSLELSMSANQYNVIVVARTVLRVKLA